MTRPKKPRVWMCKSNLHAQPCWHAKCVCGWATAFDFTEEEARKYLDDHDCPIREVQARMELGA